jgi:hypothetical protein
MEQMTMNGFDLVEPLIGETWVVNGQQVMTPPGDTDALYIRPMLHQRGVVPSGTKVLHSLVLDNNVFADIVGDRRSANTEFLDALLRIKPLALNPLLAMLEQREKFGGASQALHDFAELLGKRFGVWAAKQNAGTFDRLLEDGKPALVQNIDLLAGYMPAILYIYHQNGSAEFKLEWLGGMIKELDLPFFQLPFYLGALLFLAKEQPTLFRNKVISKVRKDTKLASTIEEQRIAVRNLAHDAMLPAMALFSAGAQAEIVFPYIATRDYLLQDFLAEVRCSAIVPLPDGRANGVWELNPAGRLHAQLANAVIRFLPRRTNLASKVQKSIRHASLRAFSNSYLEKCVSLKQADVT